MHEAGRSYRMSELLATYILADPGCDAEKRAEQIAIGLTVGSWTDLPLLKQEQLKKHKGRVVNVEETESELGEKQATVTIAYPEANFTNDIPAVLTTVFGKLSLDGKIKLADLEFSRSFKQSLPGPKFGVYGIRKKIGEFERPLLMSIFKGVIGRDMEDLKEQLRQQALGGVDLIKDDEILFETGSAPFEKRITEGKKCLRKPLKKQGAKRCMPST